MPDIARTRHDITPEWTEQVLRNGGVLADDATRIASIDTQLIGNGTTGCVARIAISYSGPERAVLPKSLAVKLASENEQRRAYAATERGLYQNEIRFYRELAPTVGIRVPRCYFAAIEPATGWFNLVLEDLSGVARPGDSVAGGTLQQARWGLEQLVALQAPRWNDPALVAAVSPTERDYTARQFDGFVDAAEQPIRELGRGLETAQIELVRQVMPRAPEWLASWQPPFTIQHGDFRLDNMLFGSVPSAPTLTVVDWQLTRIGPPALDIAYFLGECLPADARRAHEQGLLRAYHAALLEAGVTG